MLVVVVVVVEVVVVVAAARNENIDYVKKKPKNDASEKGKRVGSKGKPIKQIKAGGGVQGGGRSASPAMRTKKEAHRHKWRWISIKIE